MLARLQAAHYVEGRRIADRDVLVALAEELGLEPQAFQQALEQVDGEVTQQSGVLAIGVAFSARFAASGRATPG